MVEVDGGVHRLPEVALRDARRQAWIESQGYRVFRFSNEQVAADLGAVVETIAAAERPTIRPPRWEDGVVVGRPADRGSASR